MVLLFDWIERTSVVTFTIAISDDVHDGTPVLASAGVFLHVSLTSKHETKPMHMHNKRQLGHDL